MADNSISFHRVFKTTPEKLFRALTEPLAFAAWLPPYGFVAEVHSMDVSVGGGYKMSFTNFTTSAVQSFTGKYLEIKKNEFLKNTDVFDNPNLPGEMTKTFWIKKVSVGTELKILHEGIPAMIPVEACYLGWQDSLDKLMRLVEPNIPDA